MFTTLIKVVFLLGIIIKFYGITNTIKKERRRLGWKIKNLMNWV